MFVFNYQQWPRTKFGIGSFAIYSDDLHTINLPVKMAESQNNETTHEIETIIKDVLDEIMDNIDYELMEEKPRRIGDIDEEPTNRDLAVLLFYAIQSAGGNSSKTLQLDDESSTGPVEWIKDDVVADAGGGRSAQ